ncbi:MAG TPA: dephospho-CoA kinase [Candidatus Eisenbacteria bacterium]|jgi:dephospho-CoA kinase|nr:dephospho-CoA kinase [Candidatus Eisenbacteria bacterium]
MVRIGVTGAMASGKSTLARRFRDRGADLVDGDALGWEVLRLPEVRDAIAEAFGAGVMDRQGHVDRARLGAVVFADPDRMRRLNAIVQPKLLERVRAAMDEPGGGVRVLDAAMLTTWRLEPELDGVIEVVASEDERARRLRAARAFADEEARGRIQGQKLPAVRGAKRLWKVENVGDKAALLTRADAIWDEIQSLSEAKA